MRPSRFSSEFPVGTIVALSGRMSVQLPIANLSNQALLEETRNLAFHERRVTARLIAALTEVAARRLHVDEGFPSLAPHGRCPARAMLEMDPLPCAPSEESAYLT